MAPNLTGALQDLLTGVAYTAAMDRAFLRITGSDATRWLNGMVTNSIQSLQPGEGNYNFLLNAQGRILGDCTIYRDADVDEPAFLLGTDARQVDSIRELLDRFIIMDDVELQRAYERESGLLLLGPKAEEIVRNYVPTRLEPLHIVPVRTHGSMLLLTPAPSLIPAFEVRAEPASMLDLQARVEERGVRQISADELEALRVLEARPRYGTDIRNNEVAKDLPQETGQSRALHFAKGCYVGQEIVERIRSRGQVHRLFTPFRLKGSVPKLLPAPLLVNGKTAGELTSVATIGTSEGTVPLALGYARREFLEINATLEYEGGVAFSRKAGSLE